MITTPQDCKLLVATNKRFIWHVRGVMLPRENVSVEMKTYRMCELDSVNTIS